MQAEATVHNPEKHQALPVPPVDVADNAASLVPEVMPVVQPTQNGLQPHQAAHEDTKPCMCVLEELRCDQESASWCGGQERQHHAILG